jgi:hypothetical protein
MQNNLSERLALARLQGARERARLKRGNGNRYYAAMVLRRETFILILRMAPSLVHYELDFSASAPQWPRFRPMFENCVIEFGEAPL